MTGTKTWMLGAAMVAGTAALGATEAHGAQFGIYVGTPAEAVPPCPGPGYVWLAGYSANGYWIPGRWEFRGAGRYQMDRYEDDRGWDRDYRYGRGYRAAGGWDRRHDRDRW